MILVLATVVGATFVGGNEDFVTGDSSGADACGVGGSDDVGRFTCSSSRSGVGDSDDVGSGSNTSFQWDCGVGGSDDVGRSTCSGSKSGVGGSGNDGSGSNTSFQLGSGVGGSDDIVIVVGLIPLVLVAMRMLLLVMVCCQWFRWQCRWIVSFK
uniref:Cell wall protein IFF6-like n=1 Tax=Saccoglossus kowalevskii TaxID=10224 RepID=A0ABM0MBI0_SACKO|nr:PREDICTED: cell wall protein IFF6-like [Saccoglossus kowalevskii]